MWSFAVVPSVCIIWKKSTLWITEVGLRKKSPEQDTIINCFERQPQQVKTLSLLSEAASDVALSPKQKSLFSIFHRFVDRARSVWPADLEVQFFVTRV